MANISGLLGSFDYERNQYATSSASDIYRQMAYQSMIHQYGYGVLGDSVAKKEAKKAAAASAATEPTPERRPIERLQIEVDRWLA